MLVVALLSALALSWGCQTTKPYRKKELDCQIYDECSLGWGPSAETVIEFI